MRKLHFSRSGNHVVLTPRRLRACGILRGLVQMLTKCKLHTLWPMRPWCIAACSGRQMSTMHKHLHHTGGLHAGRHGSQFFTRMTLFATTEMWLRVRSAGLSNAPGSKLFRMPTGDAVSWDDNRTVKQQQINLRASQAAIPTFIRCFCDRTSSGRCAEKCRIPASCFKMGKVQDVGILVTI